MKGKYKGFKHQVSRTKTYVLILASCFLLLTSCKVFYPSQMLRPGRHYKYAQLNPYEIHQEYRIAPYDFLSFTITPNNGEKLLIGGGISQSGGTGSGYSIEVESDGKAKFPVFGRIQISGMTIREAEKMLEERFAVYFKEPFVQLKVTNKRVILIYSGGAPSSASSYGNYTTSSGISRVIELSNDNTTLFEVLANNGGISGGKAYKIKIIRGNLRNPQIFVIDLSTIKSVVKSDLVLQANDIIYLEIPYRPITTIPALLAPYISFLSFIALVYSLSKGNVLK